jgi:hypothetical protein
MMNINHSAITSPLYELGKSYELDVRLADVTYKMRIELFRNTEKSDHFRCHVWELEMFRLTPTFPMDDSGQPAALSDDMVMVDRGIPRSRGSYPREEIVAPTIEAAFEIVMTDLKASLDESVEAPK